MRSQAAPQGGERPGVKLFSYRRRPPDRSARPLVISLIDHCVMIGLRGQHLYDAATHLIWQIKPCHGNPNTEAGDNNALHAMATRPVEEEEDRGVGLLLVGGGERRREALLTAPSTPQGVACYSVMWVNVVMQWLVQLSLSQEQEKLVEWAPQRLLYSEGARSQRPDPNLSMNGDASLCSCCENTRDEGRRTDGDAGVSG